MPLPFCKIYGTKRRDRMIGFPLRETEKGDYLQHWTLPVPANVDLDVLAKILNQAAEDWLEKRKEEE